MKNKMRSKFFKNTTKAALKEVITPLEGKIVAEATIKVLAEQIGKWSEQYPEHREEFQTDVEVLWRTLFLLNKCEGIFRDPTKEEVKDLAA